VPKSKTPTTVKNRIKRLLGTEISPVNSNVLPPELMRAAEAKEKYVAIYIIAPRSQKWPISFGITTDPVATYHSFQKGWWEEHCLHVLLWTPGRPAAERVKRQMAEMLEHARRFFSRSWYDVTVEEAERALRFSATQHRVPLFDDIEKQRRIFAVAQKAWEKQMGVQAERIPVVASNVLLFSGTRTRQNAKEKT
jgi:hypothetical protein